MRSSSGLALLAIASAASAVRFEAEDATTTGDLYTATDVSGFSGSGYVAGWNNEADTLTFSVSGLAAGSYDIAIVYSAQYGDKYTLVSVNGAASSEVSLANVTTSTWTDSLAGSFDLTATTNTVVLNNHWGYYFIDAITVTPAPVKPVIVVNVTNGATAEAEDGILNGVTVVSSVKGFSGTGYVQGFDASTDSVTLTLFSAKQALYDVVVGYDSPNGAKKTIMSVNGGGGGEVSFVDTSAAAGRWTNATAGQVLLNAGNNNISFINDWGWYSIDCVYVTPAPAPGPHKVSNVLVAPSPLPAAQSLFNTLVGKYGSGDIFSGQADPSGVKWLEQNVGKTPAILGVDMIDYSPSRIEYGVASSTAVEDAIAFDSRGGIVAFQWHWNAPTDLINNDTVPWWSGFYTYGTTFNLTAALADPSGDHYALLLRDMDAIAEQLLRLQAANVPVLWRPLHEADGTWFWWGAYGPESCKTLYRIMFDRYTKVHGLRNLIWVWNSITPSWYPGADVVDILGYDSYPPINDHGAVGVQYQQLISLGNDEKLVTLPEVGTIPDPDLLKLYHADWSYFVVWNGDFIESDTYNDLAFKKRIYNDPAVLKLTDLGNWKGIATTTSSIASSTMITTSRSSPATSSTISSSAISSSTISSSKTSTKALSTTSVAPVPTQGKWGQCGGSYYRGPTVCGSGTVCNPVSPPWYYQCL